MMEDNQPENAASTNENDLTETKQTEDGWIIRRPKRMKLTAEESVKRTSDFINNSKRREQFVAAVRKGKPYKPGLFP